MPLLIIFLLFVACVLACQGMLNAHDKADHVFDSPRARRTEYGETLVGSIMLGMLGPLGILIAWCMTGFAQDGFDLTF